MNYGRLVDIKCDLAERGECYCWVNTQLKRDEPCIFCLDKAGADENSDIDNDLIVSHKKEMSRDR